MHSLLSVNDILQRPVFRTARLLTNGAGLQRTVRWVHVLESDRPQQLLNGGELVLTTGVRFTEGRQLENFITDLIEGNAAGLCVELGSVIHDIPQAVVEAANKHEFPVIVFPTEVRFVDITQDIHGLILSRHHRILDDLEELTRHFNRYALDGFQSQKLLKFLAQTTQSHVVYQLKGTLPEFAAFRQHTADEFQQANVTKQSVIHDWNRFVQAAGFAEQRNTAQIDLSYESLIKFGNLALSQPIVVLGSVRGWVCLVWKSSEKQADEFRTLALDRAASALAHEEFRKISIQERQLFYEQDFVERIIGEIPNPPASVNPPVQSRESPLFGMGLGRDQGTVYHAVIITADSPAGSQADPSTDWIKQRIDIAASARLSFSRQQLECALSVRKQALVCIVAHPPGSGWKLRFRKAFYVLANTLHHSNPLRENTYAYVGSSAETLKEVWQSYHQAERLASRGIQEPLHQTLEADDNRITFYEDLGVYRWLDLTEDNAMTNRLVVEEIGSLRAYDRTHKTELLTTLKTYLDCDRSVQQAASMLSIHRQTLYHRLHQIEEIIPEKLDNPQQRLAIHCALYYEEYRP